MTAWQTLWSNVNAAQKALQAQSHAYDTPAGGDFERYVNQLIAQNNRQMLDTMQAQQSAAAVAAQRHASGAGSGRAAGAAAPNQPPATTRQTGSHAGGGQAQSPHGAATPAQASPRLMQAIIALVVLLVLLPGVLKPLPLMAFVAALAFPPSRHWLLSTDRH